ncbi:MAG: hypothetical protein ACYC6N_09685, partial [Pirellulaceae bacterium]
DSIRRRFDPTQIRSDADSIRRRFDPTQIRSDADSIRRRFDPTVSARRSTCPEIAVEMQPV